MNDEGEGCLAVWCSSIGNRVSSWRSGKQNTVARSRTEAEYRASATIVLELEAVKGTLKELGFEAARPMVVNTDNTGAAFIAKNPVGHSRLKHLALDLYFVREKCDEGSIVVKHV